MQYDSSEPMGFWEHAKGCFLCVFVSLTPWWPEFRLAVRARRRFIAEMGLTKEEFRTAQQLMRRGN